MSNFWGTFWPLISNFYLSLFFIYLTVQCWGSKIVTKSAWFCKLLFFLEHGIIFSVQVLFSPYLFALCSGSVHCVSWDCDILLQQSANLPMDPWHLSVGGISVLQGYWDNHQVSMLNTFPWPREVSFGNFKLFRYSVLKQSLFCHWKMFQFLIFISRSEDGLARDVVKHLQRIEEQILESRAWISSSPIWDAIR